MRPGPQVNLRRLAAMKSPDSRRRRSEHIQRLADALIAAFERHAAEFKTVFDEDSFGECLDWVYGTVSAKHLGWTGEDDDDVEQRK